MDQIVSEGLSLMLFGMGFVFVFLTLLVLATTLMSKLATKYAPEPIQPPKAPAGVKTVNATNDDQLLAVLTAAVHKYRSK